MYKILKELYVYWKPYRWRFGGALATLLLSAPLIYLIPLIMGRMWDEILPNAAQPGGYIRLLGWCGLMALLACAHHGLNYLMTYGSWTTAVRVERDLRAQLFGRLQRLSLTFHGQNRVGDTMYCLTSDLMGIRNFFAYGAEQRVQMVIYFLFGVILLGCIDWEMTMLALAVFPVVGVVLYRYNARIEGAVKASRDSYGELSTIIQENINGVRVVRAFAMENREHEKFMLKARESYNNVCTLIRMYFNTYPVFLLFASACNIIVVCFGGWQVISGYKSVGTMITAFGCLYFLQWPLILIAMNTSQINSTKYSIEQVKKITLAEIDPAPPQNGAIMEQYKGGISFENVSFAFDGQEVLRDVSLTVQPGEKVAVFGTAGSGKTTLVTLVPRFRDPQSGRVLADGVDLRELDMDWWRKNIGYSLQETFLFSMSIRDNIAFGVPEATDSEIEAAARKAHIHEFVSSLPQGYETVVGEKGVGLSGGQKQRIALARAILTDPRILILDDATTAVDNVTERIIQDNIREELEGRTALIVTGRVSTAAIADRVIVLEQGRITAAGTMAELAAQPGLFRDVWLAQNEQSGVAAG